MSPLTQTIEGFESGVQPGKGVEHVACRLFGRQRYSVYGREQPACELMCPLDRFEERQRLRLPVRLGRKRGFLDITTGYDRKHWFQAATQCAL